MEASQVIVPNRKLILPPDALARVGGVFAIQHVRDGEVIDEFDSKNLVVNQGLNYLLNTALDAAAAQASWYVGLFTGNYTPLATDTASSFPTAATETAAYTVATRPAWTPPAGGSTAQSIDNSASKATFTMNAAATIYGAFLISSNTINNTNSATAGVLFAASQFSAPRSVVANDQLLITYAVSAVSA